MAEKTKVTTIVIAKIITMTEEMILLTLFLRKSNIFITSFHHFGKEPAMSFEALDLSWMGIPYIFIAFLIFCAVTAHMRRKANREEEKNRDDLFVAEEKANRTRAVDLSSLEYLKVSLDMLPMESDIPEVAACEEKVRILSEKRILNLNHMTNTEIKLAYGAANLEMLSTYDDNFTELVMTLNEWGRLLIENAKNSDAIPVLSYAVGIGSDIKTTYTMLGDLYFALGQFDKIDGLIATAEGLDSLSKTPILNALRSY